MALYSLAKIFILVAAKFKDVADRASFEIRRPEAHRNDGALRFLDGLLASNPVIGAIGLMRTRARQRRCPSPTTFGRGAPQRSKSS
jgi:hypothetical protein